MKRERICFTIPLAKSPSAGFNITLRIFSNFIEVDIALKYKKQDL